ncbi:hypothetical protein [Ferrimonas gelatinilytica]
MKAHTPIALRLFSTLILIVALVSQGAVARVHLMPDLPAAEMVATHGGHVGGGSESQPCDSSMPAEHDCCDEAPASMTCHGNAQPCSGECGQCQVFSPAVVALLGNSLPNLLPTPERALPQAKSFHSVSLSRDSKPPIA